MRDAEARWFAAGGDSFFLMERAARAVALHAGATPAGSGPTHRILVVAGPGNNGGDGFLAARILRAGGHAVRVIATTGARRGDAARAEALWRETGGEISAPDAGDLQPDLVIDALFGIGLSRAPAGEAAVLIERMRGWRAAGAKILSVDMPSGVASDSGETPGIAVEADETLTFHTGKPGHHLFPGRACCGTLHVVDIGLPPTPTTLFRNGAPHRDLALWRWPQTETATHKYARGGALFWCGPPTMTAPARLAAYGALRAGAGAALITGRQESVRAAANLATAPILAPYRDRSLLEDRKWRALCIGPGAGVGVEDRLPDFLAAGKPLVLDADALTRFPGGGGALAGAVRGEVVLTPHEGEFRTLFPHLTGDRLQRARQAATETGAVVVLKGPDTVVAAPDGRAAINGNAPPSLATAGSGDVLAGFVTGLLAQGMPAFEAALAGVFLHGAAGAVLGPGLVADDLVGPDIRPVIARMEQYR